jgi:hypothetical protein
MSAVPREDLLAYSAATYQDLLLEAGIPPTDTPEGLKYPLDRALGALGDDPSTEAAYALTDYHVLRQIQDAIAAVVDAQGTGFSAGKGGQIYPRLLALLDHATLRVKGYGYPDGGTPGVAGEMAVVRVNLDFIQPLGGDPFA